VGEEPSGLVNLAMQDAQVFHRKEEDVIVTREFTAIGRIQGGGLRAKSEVFGDVLLPLASLRTMHVHDKAEREFSVAADKFGEAWYDTKIHVDGFVKLRIDADGQVDLWPMGPGQYMVSPKGFTTTGKGGDFMAGALVGRIGESGWSSTPRSCTWSGSGGRRSTPIPRGSRSAPPPTRSATSHARCDSARRSRMREPSVRVVEALAVAKEVCGANITPAAARVMNAELAKYPEEWVLRALMRCVRECKHQLTLADIIERIDDGRPSADEAWALVGTDDEGVTIVANSEAFEAMQIARPLLERDETGARMAFKRRYETLLTEARLQGKPAEWTISLGWDKSRQAGALLAAVRAGRITEDQAQTRLGMPLANLQPQLGPLSAFLQRSSTGNGE
jgi:hypothetical protein